MANRRFRSKPRKVSGFITSSLHPNVIKRMKVAEIGRNWNEVVGSTLASRSSVSGMDGERLLVVAYSSSYAQQIKMRAGTICRKIKYIWDIDFCGIAVFVGKERSRPKNEDFSGESTGSMIKLSSLEIRQEMDVLKDKLNNKELARSIAGLKAIYRKRFGKKV